MRYILLLLLLTGLVGASLSEYPEMFFVKVGNKNFFNGMIIVGNNADSSDSLAALDIATSLNYYLNSDTEIIFHQASEVRGQEFNKNLILVGGPCINSATAAVMGFPDNCAEGFWKGKAKIKLYDNGDHKVLVVAGLTASDTKLAAQVLAKNFYDMTGDEVQVAGSSIKDVAIRPQ